MTEPQRRLSIFHLRRTKPWRERLFEDDPTRLAEALKDEGLESLAEEGMYGEGPVRDYQRAMEGFLRRRVAASASWRLARAYETGEGVAMDMHRACLWYWVAAAKSPPAAWRLSQFVDEPMKSHYLWLAAHAADGQEGREAQMAQAMARLALAAREDDPAALQKSLDLVLGLGMEGPLVEEARKSLAQKHTRAGGVVVVETLGGANSKEWDFSRYTPLMEKVPLAALAQPDQIIATLRVEFPWMEEVIALIARRWRLACAFGQSAIRLPPILLLGPPGSGKTRFCRRLAEACRLPHRIIAVGGASDNRSLQGTSRGWSSAHPSVVIDLIADTLVSNPLVVLDEIDKEGENRQHGRITDTLLQLLEGENAAHFYDEFIQGKVNLSCVNWIATANTAGALGKYLLSRFRIIRVPLPSKEHLPGIVAGVLADLAQGLGVSPKMLPAPDERLWKMIDALFDGNPRHLQRMAELWLEEKVAFEAKSPH